MTETFNNYENYKKFTSEVVYTYSEDIAMWEGKVILTQQYGEIPSEESEEAADLFVVTLSASDEDFSILVDELSSMTEQTMLICGGDFRRLGDESP